MAHPTKLWQDHEVGDTPLRAAALRELEERAYTYTDQQLASVARTWFNVREPIYGGVGDGATDDTDAIVAALADAHVDNSGGGIVYLPPGIWLVSGLELWSKIHLMGLHRAVTLLKLINGSNVDLIKTENFETLAAASSTPDGAPSKFEISRLTLDGNRANNSSGRGMALCGYDYRLTNFIIRNCAGQGLKSVMRGDSDSLSSADADSMESILLDFKVHDNSGGGIYWDGPHDGRWTEGIVYRNAPTSADTGSSTDGIQIIHSNIGESGPFCYGVHSWGREQRYAWNVQAPNVSMYNCQGEGAQLGQIYFWGANAFNLQIRGGAYFGARSGAGGPSAVGIVLGDGVLSPFAPPSTYVNCDIETKITNCPGGAIVNKGLGDGSRIRVMVFQSSFSAWYGFQPFGLQDIQLFVTGGATSGITGGATYWTPGPIRSAGHQIIEGANTKQGVATLVSGAVVVSNTSVTANSRILLTAQDNNSTGSLRVSARTAGTSFTITSSNSADHGVVAYEIFEPAA